MNAYAQSALLGAMSGIRSTSGTLAARWGQSGAVPVGSVTALAGETIADKLPFVPARTSPGGLVSRVGGAIYAVKSGSKRPALGTYAVAAAAAIVTAVAATRLRKAIVERKVVPDFAVGLAEDLVVAGLIWAARA